MMCISSKKGSAILIVLGMLSFMVVSAVGFAVYMRQSRMPSSHLRRAASARYLLKAALANAIARLDGCSGVNGQGQTRCEGVYDDPYPGVGPKIQAENGSSHSDDGDFWVKRIFTPFGQVSPDSTVSTLTLEGLAYLPPAVINEARAYSRRTRTAQWKNLAYDAGRYAFTAIDVSDCFDINKLFAGERRFSAPGQRVNLSSLFPQNGDRLDDILAKCSKLENNSNIPFISLADFNIVAGPSSPFAPWTRYINSPVSASIYTQSDHESVSNALFVTDTWFPPSNRVDTVRQINLAKKRPFSNMNERCFPDIDQNGNELYTLLMKNIGGVGLTCLYDYLDKDRRPLSLALPTVETQPMVCGVSPAVEDVKIDYRSDASVTCTANISRPGGGEYRITRTVVPHRLRLSQSQMMVSGVAAYPFKRISGNKKGSWTVETLVSVFFAEGPLQSRVNKNSPLRPTENDWSGPQHVRDGIVWLKGQGTQLSFPDNIARTDDAVTHIGPVQVSLPEVNYWIGFEVTETQKVYDKDGNELIGDPNAYQWTKWTTDETRSAQGQLIVYDNKGTIPAWWRTLYQRTSYKDEVAKDNQALAQPDGHGPNSQNFQNDPIANSGGLDVRPYVAVWVRIKDGSDVVDLVPATCDDDGIQLQGVNYAGLETEIYKMSGDGTPLLDFRYDPAFKFSADPADANGFASIATPKPLNASGWKSLYAPDPRYNFAPEDWFGTMDEDADPAKWRQYVKDGYLGKNGRDRDIFMFTSDQEYLQSIGELAFLPFVQEMNGNASFFEGNFMNAGRYHGRNDFSARAPGSDQGFANGWRFWRTYTAYDNGDGIDPIYNLRDGSTRYEVVSGVGDFRVNPYSPDTRVLMAALKDTPYDWSVASTNTQTNSRTVDLKPTNRARWAFCEESSIARLNDDELEDLATRLRNTFDERARHNNLNRRFDWQGAYDGLKWYDTNNAVEDQQKTIFNIAEDFDQPLHGVDRKYLHAFWRDCFQNRQHLFLVFVRAEPLTVGGSGGQSLGSSQLGARGVALVWRDPQPPSRGNRPARTALTSPQNWETYYNNNAPHRTRVLFYHQFD